MGDPTPGFLGRGWRFPPRFDVVETDGQDAVGHAAMVEGEVDIFESLEILLKTIPGERVMRPTFGLGIQTHVFDSTDETSLTYLRDRIEKAVVFFEDRIRLQSVDFDTHALNEGRLDIVLDYIIPATNSRGNRVFPYYFREGTTLPQPAANAGSSAPT